MKNTKHYIRRRTASPVKLSGKAAYSYLELIIVLGVLGVTFSAFLLWQRGYVRGMRDVAAYYQEREAILNRIELLQADQAADFEGLRRYEINWRQKKIIWLGR
ncbi:hypothetical protein NO2_0787 [Candidatus Termititenax persephonae]|uniref:Uncharacterized protein n=1 Tax=Candidatus Termititenax persephonae TaxID=2218525 RepID=A0A388TH32_9BACT|nr:hypothetical protein NO2_0787 [Candidatus Termititenax persephonae]